MESLVEMFCDVDDFCQIFLPQWETKLLASGEKQRRRPGQLSISEIMTIVIHFHQSNYRTFKAYYSKHVCVNLRAEFPGLVSYERFVALMPSVLGPMIAYLYCLFGECSGISFIDSTSLVVCHNKRIPRHKVFTGLAARGKTSMGWFYGFKLHLVVNDQGEIMAFCLTPGNVDDRKPVPILAKNLFGKLFGDRGYISQPLFDQLMQLFNVQLITKLRRNMKNRLMPIADKILLRKRAIIETVIDQLKNISQIEHSRHRSPVNYFVNVLAGLIAYSHQPKKPSLHFGDLERLPALIHN